MKLDILLTDGNYQHTYAILLALKEKKLKVGIIFNYKPSLSFFSRFADKRFFVRSDIVKDPSDKNIQQYSKEIFNILRKNSIDVFLPIGNMSCRFASLYKHQLEKYCKVPIVDYNLMQIAQNKQSTFKYAKSIAVPVPLTFEINDAHDIDDILSEITLPCVIKKTNYFEGGVIYCNTKDELRKKLVSLLLKKGDKDYTNPIVQEYILGKGMGYYGIYENGQCLGFFMHERIHEYPITGGASTFAKSVYDEELKNLGDKILTGLNWHGVAMVEFKKDSKSNQLKLMEINPKFWGSLELSYKAGINFPYLSYLLAMGEPITKANYFTEVYFRWILPFDLIWFRFASKEKKKEYRELKKRVKIFNNLHWNDPLIIIFNLIFTLLKLIKEKKYPHGHIQQKN